MNRPKDTTNPSSSTLTGAEIIAAVYAMTPAEVVAAVNARTGLDLSSGAKTPSSEAGPPVGRVSSVGVAHLD